VFPPITGRLHCGAKMVRERYPADWSVSAHNRAAPLRHSDHRSNPQLPAQPPQSPAASARPAGGRDRDGSPPDPLSSRRWPPPRARNAAHGSGAPSALASRHSATSISCLPGHSAESVRHLGTCRVIGGVCDRSSGICPIFSWTMRIRSNRAGQETHLEFSPTRRAQDRHGISPRVQGMPPLLRAPR
jgi:hypothetical protein